MQLYSFKTFNFSPIFNKYEKDYHFCSKSLLVAVDKHTARGQELHRFFHRVETQPKASDVFRFGLGLVTNCNVH
jgi:hypothetical protein